MEEIAERGAMFLPIMMQATEEDGTRDYTPCSCYFGDRSERIRTYVAGAHRKGTPAVVVPGPI